jgi:hypothetical protein
MAKTKKEGFITLHKSIQSWKYYKDHYAYRIYTHLIINAAYSDMLYGDIKIKRGQWMGSRGKLEQELFISPPTIRKWMKLLIENNDLIETRLPGNLGSLFDVVNYDKYQPGGGKKGGKRVGKEVGKNVSGIKERENSPLTGVRSHPQILFRDDEDYLQQNHISNRKLN